MKNRVASERRHTRTDKRSSSLKAIGFWVFFFLLLAALRNIHLPVLGNFGAPAIAGLLIAASLLAIAILLKSNRESFGSVGLRVDWTAALQLVSGLGLGVAVVAAMIGALLGFTPLQVNLSGHDGVLAILLISFLIIAVLALMEEIAFRSYPFFKLRQSLGIRPAVYLSSIVFAFYHGLAVENLLGPGVWGLFYAWMALKTNSIALPTGFHIGLNWVQALLGMKPQYGDSIWQFSVGSEPGLVGVEDLGIAMQFVLFIIGVLLIERFVRSRSGEVAV